MSVDLLNQDPEDGGGAGRVFCGQEQIEAENPIEESDEQRIARKIAELHERKIEPLWG